MLSVCDNRLEKEQQNSHFPASKAKPPKEQLEHAPKKTQ